MGILLFHGGEPYLAERAFLDAWQRLSEELGGDIDAAILDAGTSPAEVAAAAGTIGFFSPGRLIGIREWKPLLPGGGRRSKAKGDAPDPASVAAEALAAMPDDAHLLLLVSVTVPATNPVLRLAQERGEVRSFARLRWRDLQEWTGARARELGLKLDSGATRELVNATGDDLRLIDSELAKLATFAEGRPVSVADVHELVPDTAEHQVWDLTDSLLSNPGKAALELDRALARGDAAGYISYMLVRHLRLVLAARDAPAGAQGSAALTAAFADDGRPLSDFTIEKAFSQAKGVDRGRLEMLYRRAAGAEAASRRGELEDEQALRLVVLEAGL